MSSEVSKAHATPSCFSLDLMVVVSSCKFSALLECHACLPAAILPAIVVMDSALETVSPSVIMLCCHNWKVNRYFPSWLQWEPVWCTVCLFIYSQKSKKNQHMLKLQKWEFHNLLGKFLLEHRFLNFNVNQNQLRSLLKVSFPGLWEPHSLI